MWGKYSGIWSLMGQEFVGHCRQWAALGRSVCTVLVQLGPAVATIIDRWLAALNYRHVPLYNYWGEPE